MCTGKEASFPVFGTFRRGFGTFVRKIRVYMSRVEIIEIRGVSGVFRIFRDFCYFCGRRNVFDVIHRAAWGGCLVLRLGGV